MIISNKHKFVFVSTPKTGTHSLYKYLVNEYDGYRYGGFHERQIPEFAKDYFVFTTFRNPYERVVAAWNSLMFQEKYREDMLELIGDDSFQSFIRYLNYCGRYKEIKGSGGAVMTPQTLWLKGVPIDQYIRTENMNKDFCTLPFSKGDDNLPQLLKREHKSFDELSEKLETIDQLFLCNFLYNDDVQLGKINRFYEEMECK